MASHSQQPPGKRVVVGITGHIGSGKTTVGRYLESTYGFQYLRYSAVLADWMAKDYDSRAHLQKVGWEVMDGGMQAELNRRLVAQIISDKDVTVDGLRHPLDYETLHNSFLFSFCLIFIDSTRQLRFDRLCATGKYQDLASLEFADSHPVERKIDSLRANAAFVINNEGSLKELYATVDETVSGFRKEGQT